MKIQAQVEGNCNAILIVTLFTQNAFFLMYILKEMSHCNKSEKGKVEENLPLLLTEEAGLLICYQHAGHHLNVFIIFFSLEVNRECI